MQIKYEVAILILILLSFCTFNDAHASPGRAPTSDFVADITGVPTRDGKVLMSKKDFLDLQQYILWQQKQMATGKEKAEYWEGKYEEAEQCVTDTIKRGGLVMLCFKRCDGNGANCKGAVEE